jgi:pimeloyl-ACP methyl ester carboxylesterase
MSKRQRAKNVAIPVGVLLACLAVVVYAAYKMDSRQWERSSSDSLIAETPCGPIEYAVAGSGAPLLVVHGAGGGFDQGLELAREFVQRNFKVIAMSRFGYLRTPLPDDASAAAQADAHLCLMNALGIERAAIVGVSAGGPSAMQFAIRHPDRAVALFLLVPAAYRPNATAPEAYRINDGSSRRTSWSSFLLDTAIKSDLLFWLAMHITPQTLIRSILGTPPELVKNAERSEQERVQRFMKRILPISRRQLGLLNDLRVTSTLSRYDLERIQAPTLIISVKDDGYGTYDGARYSADHIAGVRFIGYDEGGHICVGHNTEIMEEAVRFLQKHGA